MIHQYKQAGHCIVLDAPSGAVHVVDPVAYDMIARYPDCRSDAVLEELLSLHKADDESLTLSDLRDCLSDIEALREQGLLFSEDLLLGLPKHPLDGAEPVLKAMCLHVAHSCNLNCSYCFARQGNYHGAEALMPFEVGKRALDMLGEKSGNRRNLEVDFFGGEPLLNWQVVKDLVLYARSIEKEKDKNFRFTLTTNGMLLDDEVIDFANREMHNVVLSLDGREEVHDALRRDMQGKGSYATILPKFQKLVAARDGKDYYMRGTFTRANLDFTTDILHMADLGFRELSMEPVVCEPSDPLALREEDLPRIFEQYERLADEMLKRRKAGEGFTFYHFMLDLEGGPCLPKRLLGCGSGSEYVAVPPPGAIYPSHQFVRREPYRMGPRFDGLSKPSPSS